LNQISESLLKYKEQVGVRVSAQDQAFKEYKTVLMRLEEALTSQEHKDMLRRVLEASAVWQQQQKDSFDFLSLTSKHLYTMVESIAEKEI
jgi:hypothetical protein